MTHEHDLARMDDDGGHVTAPARDAMAARRRTKEREMAEQTQLEREQERRERIVFGIYKELSSRGQGMSSVIQDAKILERYIKTGSGD